MQIHPRIMDRARQTLSAKSMEIDQRRSESVQKLDAVLDFLRRGGGHSERVDLARLVADIESVRDELAAFRLDFTSTDVLSDSIVARLRHVHMRLKSIEEERRA